MIPAKCRVWGCHSQGCQEQKVLWIAEGSPAWAVFAAALSDFSCFQVFSLGLSLASFGGKAGKGRSYHWYSNAHSQEGDTRDSPARAEARGKNDAVAFPEDLWCCSPRWGNSDLEEMSWNIHTFHWSEILVLSSFTATALSLMTAAMQEECDLPSSLLLPGRPCMLHPPAERRQHMMMVLRAHVAVALSVPVLALSLSVQESETAAGMEAEPPVRDSCTIIMPCTMHVALRQGVLWAYEAPSAVFSTSSPGISGRSAVSLEDYVFFSWAKRTKKSSFLLIVWG